MTTPREASTTPSIWALDASSMPCTSRSDLCQQATGADEDDADAPTRPSTRASRSERRRCGRPSSRRRVRFEITSTRAPTRHRTAQNASAYARASAGSRGIGASRHRGRRGAGSSASAGGSAGSCRLRRGAGSCVESRRRRRRAPSGRRRTRPSRRRANDGTNGASPACRRVPHASGEIGTFRCHSHYVAVGRKKKSAGQLQRR